MKKQIIKIENKGLEKRVNSILEEIKPSFAIFNRSHSNFTWKTMTIGGEYTPLRRLRQISAELSRKKDALIEAKYAYLSRIKQAEIKYDEAEKEQDPLRKEYKMLKAEELQEKAEMVHKPYLGAMKDVLELGNLYKQTKELILNKYGKLDEEVFEIEEAKYWVIRAFAQGLRGIRQAGTINAGDQELLEHIGLDPSTIQNLLCEFLENQKSINVDSQELESFLVACAEKYYRAGIERMKRVGFSEVIERENIYTEETEAL
jgi:hypothetical protein